MSQTTIMKRLVILTAVPVIALMLSSGTLIWNSYEQYRNSVQADKIIGVAVASGDLIHPLQIERGMTAGLIQSGGQKFADTLPASRAKTDEKLAEFRRKLEIAGTDSMPELKQAAEEGLRVLDSLSRTRDQANRYTIPAGEASAFFTGTIASLLDVMSSASEYNGDPEIAKKLAAYHAFVNAKENAGQERALSVPVFVSNKVEPAQFRNILGKIYKQEAYLDSFIDSASDQEIAALKGVLDSEAAKEVQRMRGIMAERNVQGGFEVNSAAWFKAITDKINGLYEVEQLITKNIHTEIDKQMSAGRAQMAMRIIVATLVIITAMIIAVWVARSVSHSPASASSGVCP